MRIRSVIAGLALFGALACDNDDPSRDTLSVSGDPSTATPGDGGDPRQVTPRAPGSGPPNAIPEVSPGGGRSNNNNDEDESTDGGLPQEGDASADAGIDPYACSTANDCAVLNVNSCCGFFPTCARPGTTFPPPGNCADAGAGSCQYPPVNGCDCINARCVNLTGGTLNP